MRRNTRYSLVIPLHVPTCSIRFPSASIGVHLRFLFGLATATRAGNLRLRPQHAIDEDPAAPVRRTEGVPAGRCPEPAGGDRGSGGARRAGPDPATSNPIQFG